jgi:hypothetical protein
METVKNQSRVANESYGRFITALNWALYFSGENIAEI